MIAPVNNCHSQIYQLNKLPGNQDNQHTVADNSRNDWGVIIHFWLEVNNFIV